MQIKSRAGHDKILGGEEQSVKNSIFNFMPTKNSDLFKLQQLEGCRPN